MAKNKVQRGHHLPYINSTGAAISSGDPVLVGGLLGVALGDIANGASGQLDLEGVYELPKASGAISQGAILYWDADGDPVGGVEGAGALTTTSTDNTRVGVAFAAATETAGLVRIRLNV